MIVQKIVIPAIRQSQHSSLIKYNKLACLELFRRYKSDKKESFVTKSTSSEVDTNVKPLGEKVKETTKTASYLGVILLGVAVTGSLFYAVFNELFSSKSPNNVYSNAVKRCVADPRVLDKLGAPLKSYGEETRRRRRQHVQHVKYIKDEVPHLRMVFYLQGTFHKGTVHLEMYENEFGDYDYRYLFIDVDDLARSTIVLEDNRNRFTQKGSSPSFNFNSFQ